MKSVSDRSMPCRYPRNASRKSVFNKTNNLRHRIFGWKGDQNMNMIGHQMPFFYPTLFVLRQSPQYLTEVCSQLTIQHLPTPLGYEHNVVLAVPFRVV